MKVGVFEALKERGFVQQCTDDCQVPRILDEGKITYYAGFDPTADSLHVGSLMPIMAMVHLQRAGHIPIAIIGGGTAMIGDPSGKTQMRQMLSVEDIDKNGQGIEVQLKRYLNLDGENGFFVNNADWLLKLNYIEFLRDIGKCFRVNEMIKAEAYKARLEREDGLSFIEFNYQLLQAYDFLVLFDKYNCQLQVGGDDQWTNILAGTDLIRRLRQTKTYGLTFPLLTTARGQKMGKTENGTVWLDSARTSPYDFYQYWINVDDRDVKRFLAFFTFLPIDEVNRLGELQDKDIRIAKEVLAFEVTKLAHGEVEATKAQETSRTAFSGSASNDELLPTYELDDSEIQAGIPILDLMVRVSAAGSKGAARRLIQQGAVRVNDEKIQGEPVVGVSAIRDGKIMLRVGQKKHYKIILKGG